MAERQRCLQVDHNDAVRCGDVVQLHSASNVDGRTQRAVGAVARTAQQPEVRTTPVGPLVDVAVQEMTGLVVLGRGHHNRKT